MELQGFLIGFAQLALVLTGFVSVFALLLTTEEEKSRVDTHHSVSLLVSSLITVVASLVPIVLFHYGLEGHALWWWSSLVATALVVASFCIIIPLTLQLTKVEFKEAGYLHMCSSYSFATFSFSLLAWNVFVQPSAGNYVLAIVMLFLIAVIGFVTLSIQKTLYW